MTSFRAVRRFTLLLVVLLGATSVHFATRACSFARGTTVDNGPLGFSWGTAAYTTEVPANVAVIAPDSFAVFDAGPSMTWEAVPGHRWSVPTTPFAGGSELQFGSRYVTVGSYVDTVAPSAPTILAASVHVTSSGVCARSTCGSHASFELRVSTSSDDHTNAGHITYEIYVGGTADAAQTTTLPVLLLVPSGSYLRDIGDLGDHAAYVAITAVDQAGNVSARSPSVRVSR